MENFWAWKYIGISKGTMQAKRNILQKVADNSQTITKAQIS